MNYTLELSRELAKSNDVHLFFTRRDLAAPQYTVGEGEYQGLPFTEIIHNGLIFQREHPTAGAIRQCRPAPRFSETPTEPGPIAPLLGEHTDEILAELGYDSERIERLRQANVVS